ncbi:hypothetical protein Bca4012_064585 [Brassica carinata]|uniref:Uncharacterized protein n=1 Tax=Brassica carinata TaxID=52824 RepID=A0A8X7VLJ5_BRACI|nr:hypothetical protein Bca52824_017075 [Brassica carinata]
MSVGIPVMALGFFLYLCKTWIGGLLGKLCEKQEIVRTFRGQSVNLTNLRLFVSIVAGSKEEDKPSFTGSVYSKTKAMDEELLREFDNVCTLRVRMPISSDLNNPGKLHHKVVNIRNSMTILDELFPISIEMAKRNLREIWKLHQPRCGESQRDTGDVQESHRARF